MKVYGQKVENSAKDAIHKPVCEFRIRNVFRSVARNACFQQTFCHTSLSCDSCISWFNIHFFLLRLFVAKPFFIQGRGVIG